MNTITTTTVTAHTTSRLTSIAVAAVMTLAMLAGIDTLASADKSAPQLAQATSAART